MLVNELIEKLRQYPQDMEVKLYAPEYRELRDIQTIVTADVWDKHHESICDSKHPVAIAQVVKID